MADPVTWIAIGVAVVGAGVSAYGQYQQGKSQEAIGAFNAAQQRQQAQRQLLATQTEAALQRQQAEANFTLRAAEAEARNNNAAALEAQAQQQSAVDRLNLRNRREEFARMQGTQRAAIAASGVAEATGTPLDLLAETAGKIQMDQEEQFYVAESQRRTLLNEAAMERFGGKMALVGATLDRDSQVAAAALKGTAAKGEYLGNLRSAELTRLTGKAASKAATYQAAGTIFSGVSSAAGMYYKAS